MAEVRDLKSSTIIEYTRNHTRHLNGFLILQWGLPGEITLPPTSGGGSDSDDDEQTAAQICVDTI